MAAAALAVAASKGCGSSSGGSGVPTFGDGQYRVGVDLQAGSYSTPGRGSRVCSWIVYRPNGSWNGAYAGPVTLRLGTGDRQVRFSGGCTWHRRG